MADQPIRDAATLVIVDRTGDEPRVLMGRRRPDQIFMPNVFVFPGGRVDGDDTLAPVADELDDYEAALLALPREGHTSYSPAFVRSLAMAAVRETFEETGLAVGTRSAGQLLTSDTVPVSWRPFLASGTVPRLSALRFFLRAITPKARPRRYDTRFFLVDAAEIAYRGTATDEELSEVGWYGLSALSDLDVPRITRVVIEELGPLLQQGLQPASRRRVPLLFEHNDVKCRAELSLAPTRP